MWGEHESAPYTPSSARLSTSVGLCYAFYQKSCNGGLHPNLQFSLMTCWKSSGWHSFCIKVVNSSQPRVGHSSQLLRLIVRKSFCGSVQLESLRHKPFSVQVCIYVTCDGCVIAGPLAHKPLCAFLCLVQVWVSGWVSMVSTCTPWHGSMVSKRAPWYGIAVFICSSMVVWSSIYAHQLLIVWVTLSAPPFDSETGVDWDYLLKTTQVVFVLALLRLEWYMLFVKVVSLCYLYSCTRC